MILYVVVERLYCAGTCAERAKSRKESQGLPKSQFIPFETHRTRRFHKEFLFHAARHCLKLDY